MKIGQTPKDVEAMNFERLTLVYAEKGGKRFAPVNPLSTVVATKAGEILDGAKSLLGLPTTARKDSSLDESIEVAMQQTARSMLYSTIYDLEYNISQAINAPGYDSDARRNAIDAIIEEYGTKIVGLVGLVYAEKAVAIDDQAKKAGARHSKADLESIQSAHDKIGKAKAALDKAHEATSALLADKNGDDPTSGANAPTTNGGAKAGVVNDQEAPVPLTDTEKNDIIALAAKAAIEAVKPLIAAPAPAEPATKSTPEQTPAIDVDAVAKKAADDAVAALQPQLDAAKKAADDANAEAAAARATAAAASKALEDAVGAARARKALGGHEVQTGEKATVTDDEAAARIKANPSMKLAEAVSLLCSGVEPK